MGIMKTVTVSIALLLGGAAFGCGKSAAQADQKAKVQSEADQKAKVQAEAEKDIAFQKRMADMKAESDRTTAKAVAKYQAITDRYSIVPPPIGTTEADFKAKWKYTSFNVNDYVTSYYLDYGIEVQMMNDTKLVGTVALTPEVNMPIGAVIKYNYNSAGPMFHLRSEHKTAISTTRLYSRPHYLLTVEGDTVVAVDNN